MIVRQRLHRFVRKKAAEFTPPCLREIGIRAAARGKEESAVRQIFPQGFQFHFRQHEIVVAVHEHKRRLEQFGVRQPQPFLLLHLQRRGACNEFDQILAHAAAVIAVVLAVLDAAKNEGGEIIAGILGRRGKREHAAQQEAAQGPMFHKRILSFVVLFHARFQRFRKTQSVPRQPSTRAITQPFTPTGWRIGLP